MADTDESPVFVEMKRNGIDWNKVITVLVGDQEEPLVIHQDIACRSSAFFRAACNRDFKEKKEKVVRVPEADPETFDSYTQFLYIKKIAVVQEDNLSLETLSPSEDNEDEQLRLGQLWTLADFLGDVEAKNAVVGQLAAKMRIEHTQENNLGVELIKWIWTHTPESAFIRRPIMEWAACCSRASWTSEHRKALPLEFLADMAELLAKIRGKEEVYRIFVAVELSHEDAYCSDRTPQQLIEQVLQRAVGRARNATAERG